MYFKKDGIFKVMNHDYCCNANINGGEPRDEVKTH